jgi:hypothetical protein
MRSSSYILVSVGHIIEIRRIDRGLFIKERTYMIIIGSNVLLVIAMIFTILKTSFWIRAKITIEIGNRSKKKE